MHSPRKREIGGSNDIETVGVNTGIDILKYASERIDEKFARGNVTDLPFKKEVYK